MNSTKIRQELDKISRTIRHDSRKFWHNWTWLEKNYTTFEPMDKIQEKLDTNWRVRHQFDTISTTDRYNSTKFQQFDIKMNKTCSNR